MKSRSIKQKGKRLQKKVAEKIVETFSSYGITDFDVRSALSSENGEDIKMSTAACTLFPFSIECKNHENLRTKQFWKAVEQSRANCPENRTPLVFLSKNREEIWVAMNSDLFFDMIKKINNIENKQ